jgi:hypothetical protein
MRHLRSRLVLVAVIVLSTMVLSPSTASAAARIVVLTAGTSPAAHAAEYGIHPTKVYRSAFDGYAADLNNKQINQMRRDMRVSGSYVDDTIT